MKKCLYIISYTYIFAMTLFCDLLPINWFATTKICDQALSIPLLLKQPCYNNWFAARNIQDDKALMNLPQNFRTHIKVGLELKLKIFIF